MTEQDQTRSPISHYGLVLDSTGTRADIVCGGDEQHCRQSLARWVTNHPLADGETAQVVARIEGSADA